MRQTELPKPDLPLNQSVMIETSIGPVMICHSAAGLQALRPACPHQRLSLAGARIRGSILTCPHHGARFSLEDGRSLSRLTHVPLTLLACRVSGNELVIGAGPEQSPAK